MTSVLLPQTLHQLAWTAAWQLQARPHKMVMLLLPLLPLPAQGRVVLAQLLTDLGTSLT